MDTGRRWEKGKLHRTAYVFADYADDKAPPTFQHFRQGSHAKAAEWVAKGPLGGGLSARRAERCQVSTRRRDEWLSVDMCLHF